MASKAAGKPKKDSPAKKRPSKTASAPKTKGAEGVDKVEKHAGGRPTLYKPEYAELAKKFCLLGADDKELARMFGVVESTINLWKLNHPEFSESMREGKEIADAKIAESLYHRAKGYKHDDVHISNYQGMITVTPLVKHYPPDTAAASLWLRNRQPDKWRDKVDVNHGLQPNNPLADLVSKIVEKPDSRIRSG